jgi:hypothetical protein
MPHNSIAIVHYEPACPACGCPMGDVNGDGLQNVVDVQCLTLVALWGLSGQGDAPGCLVGPLSEADLDCDGTANVIDVQVAILRALDLPVAGDPGGDGCIDACLDPLPAPGTDAAGG